VQPAFPGAVDNARVAQTAAAPGSCGARNGVVAATDAERRCAIAEEGCTAM
jgi:hypothetical protein